MNTARSPWSYPIKIVISLLILGLFIYLLSRFSVIIPPLILAIILAYIISPISAFIRRLVRFPPAIAILISYVFLLAILATLPMIIIPALANQLAGLNLDFQHILLQFEQLLGHKYMIAGQVIDLQVMFDQLIGSLQGLLEPAVGQTFGLLIDFITSIVWIVFIFVVSFYLTKDSHHLRAWVEGLIPPTLLPDFIRLRDEISQIWSAFFRGQIVLSIVVAVIFTIAGFILGLPFALGMGVLAGLLEFLPSLGHGIWLFVASIVAFFIGSTWLPLPNLVFMLLIIGLHLIFQQFDLNYLIPRIIGRRVHLPPLVVILGIVTGAILAGVLGIPLAAPTIASARVVGRYIYANLIDADPFPEGFSSPEITPNPRWWKNPRRTTDSEHK